VLQLSSQYIPKHKLAIGFEPGKQAYTGVWEGFDIDLAVAAHVHSNGYAGIFFWAVNDPKTEQTADTPRSACHAWQGSVGANAQHIARIAGEACRSTALTQQKQA
jgi:hypothetical protein